MALNPPTVVTFETKADALEHFEVLQFRRLPVPGPIERWVATAHADDGTPILIYASSAGRDGSNVKYEFVEYARP